MKLWWTSWLLCLTLASPPLLASDRPVLPPPDTAVSWDVHRSLGIVMVFETDLGKLFFAHPVLHTQKMAECRGVTISGTGHLWIIESGITGVPLKYTILKNPTGYRYEDEPWQPWVWQSFKDLNLN